MTPIRLLAACTAVALVAVFVIANGWGRTEWSDEEKAVLRGLWIGSLPSLPPDPSNRYADDPQAAALGKQLFFDKRLSVNGKVACATCHIPSQGFQDGLPLARGVGTTTRRTMPIAGTAYSPWLFWDGRKDSQWAQALGPLESAVEHGGNRTLYARVIEQYYRTQYEAVFGPLPDLGRSPTSAGPVDDPTARAAWERMPTEDREAVTRLYANIGKAIAAYERKLMPEQARFDAYAEAVLKNDAAAMHTIFTPDEAAGLRLFIGKAGCINCHSGPLFTNNDFHNTGVPAAAGLPEDLGRAVGARRVRADEFNCLSRYSDAQPAQCPELRFLKPQGEELVRAFKPPSLRSVAERAPFMHAGQFTTLEEVLDHYNRAPAAPQGHSELKPLGLSEREIDQLVAFLGTLSSSTAAAPGS